MLGKLIKYDLKYASKVFLLIHGIYLLICVALRILIMDRLNFDARPEVFMTPVTLITILMIFVLSAVTLATSLLIALRFYRNLFGREGYLSWTLPASPSEHLLAKFLSGFLLAAVDITIIATGIVIIVTGPNVAEAYRQIASEMTEILGVSLGAYSLKLFFFTVLFSFTSVIQIYFCVALGQLFQGHRVLFAIAFYFLTGFVVEIISTLLLLVSGLLTEQMTFSTSAFNLGQYTEKLYLITGMLSVILAAGEYIAAQYIMKKKINLI